MTHEFSSSGVCVWCSVVSDEQGKKLSMQKATPPVQLIGGEKSQVLRQLHRVRVCKVRVWGAKIVGPSGREYLET